MHALSEALPELPIVEDACQAHGASRRGEYAGSWGAVSCFSLNQVKPLCGGQGGLVVTNSPDIWATLTDLASPGRNDTIGLSYEITELSAAIAVSQLQRLDNVLDVANSNYELFTQCLDAQYRDIVQPCEDGIRPTWHKLRLRMSSPERDRLVRALDREGVPYETWPGTLVSERSEYRHLTAITPLSMAIMQSSFVLGNEKYPFHAQNAATIEHWASLINSELRLSRKAGT
jgi:dTDP-4-amino-4,6-dideoxygalactose transaminase